MKDFHTIIDALTNPSVDLESLAQHGVSSEGVEQAKAIRNSLIQLQQLQSEDIKSQQNKMKKSSDDTFKTIAKLKQSLEDTLSESKSSQSLAKWMFVLTFLMGFILIGISVYFGIQGNQVLAIAFGSFGIVDIIAHLIADPPLKLQDSRSNYAQLTVGILTWFNDWIDKSSMLVANSQLNAQIQSAQIDINTKLMVQDKIINNYLTLSGTQIDNTIKILKLIDEVAEPSKNKKPIVEKKEA